MASSFTMSAPTPIQPVASSENYRGRFAPSPTGYLHFGSLVAALASFLDARRVGGKWLIRVDDIDPPRAVAGSIDSILHDLEAFGLRWDDSPVYQSDRDDIYRAHLETLRSKAMLYHCSCSRKEITDSAVIGIDGPVYPGTCRKRVVTGNTKTSIRVITRDASVSFTDRRLGEIKLDLANEIGDFNLLRSDGYWAYQFATAIDDALQGITHVVRGADLLNSTPRQIYLQQLLGLPSPTYLHVPIALDREGHKLSKSENADALRGKNPAINLRKALDFLAHPPPRELGTGPVNEMIEWAIASWDPGRLIQAENRMVDF